MFSGDLNFVEKESARGTDNNLMSALVMAVYEYILETGEDVVVEKIRQHGVDRNLYPNIYDKVMNGHGTR